MICAESYYDRLLDDKCDEDEFLEHLRVTGTTLEEHQRLRREAEFESAACRFEGREE